VTPTEERVDMVGLSHLKVELCVVELEQGVFSLSCANLDEAAMMKKTHSGSP
jgi:hypothetical protein